MREFMDIYNLINLIKRTTCFKGKGSCIDLLLKKQKYSIKKSNGLQTGLTDHHFLIYSMLKTYFFPKNEPKDWFIETIVPFQRSHF